MTDWRDVVKDLHGQTESVDSFCKAVARHLSSFHAMRTADKLEPDPVDVYQQLQSLEVTCRNLGMELMQAHHRVQSFMGQGWLIRRLSGDPPEMSETGKVLAEMSFAMNEVLKDLALDDEGLRRGSRRHHTRWLFVHNVNTAYQEWLGTSKVGDATFVSTMEAILQTVGIPTGDLPRLLREADPQNH